VVILNEEIPFVSIIIPNYNGKHFLRECLDSLLRIEYPKDRYEIIVIDNGSTDGSVQYVNERYPFVRVLCLGKNYGFCTAINKGAEIAKGEYLVFLNNDTRVHPKWLQELILAVKAKGSTNVYTSKTLMARDPSIIDYAGGKISPNARGYSEKLGMKDEQCIGIKYTAYPCATSTLVRRDIFLRLGGFDEDYFACLDDVDFGIRAWIHCHKIYVVLSSVVLHHVSATVRAKGVYFSTFHHTKNALMNIIKNFEMKNVVKALLIEAIFNLHELLSSLKKGSVDDIKARLNAFIWVIRNLKKIWFKRKTVQYNRKYGDKIFQELSLFATLAEAISAYKRRERIIKSTKSPLIKYKRLRTAL
jgi:GT2 family glycosyltransferase